MWDDRPLHYAARRYDNSATVRTLVRLGANLETTEGEGCTPFVVACLYGSLRTARALLDAGAQPVPTFPPKHPALDRYGYHGPLHLLCGPGHRTRLSVGTDAARRDFSYEAVKGWDRDRLDLITSLLDRGADVNACTPGKTDPPLTLALQGAGSSLDPIVAALIKHGADVTDRGPGVAPPMHRWLSPMQYRQYDMLRQAVANMGAEGDKGETP